jgi:hypothetical protein
MTIDEAAQSRHATAAAVFAFREVEQKRLALELAEHRLLHTLRPESVSIGQYAQETETIMIEFEKKRADCIKRGLIHEPI